MPPSDRTLAHTDVDELQGKVHRLPTTALTGVCGIPRHTSLLCQVCLLR
jgi:hypothetical protein